MHTGSCLCGAVKFELHGSLREVMACHCIQCRKTHGHDWAATNVPDAQFKLVDDSGLQWYHASSSAKRGFCGKCGASLFWKKHTAKDISVAAGCIDGATGCQTEQHIFTEYAGDYYRISDQELVRDTSLDVDAK